MNIRNNKIYLLIISLVIIFSLIGCATNQNDVNQGVSDTEQDNQEKLKLDNPDLKLLAYQLELQVRSIFRTAYQSWINLNRVTKKDERDFEQITAILDASLSSFTAEEEIEKHIQKLKNINQGGEGEITFPTHEVVKSSKIESQNDNKVKISFVTTRYYPATEWAGAAYNKDFNYVVTLINKYNNWIVEDVNYNSSSATH